MIGLDLGSARIGVAVTDERQAVATPAEVLYRSGDRSSDHRAVAALVAEREAVGVVVGVPLSLSGDSGPAAQSVMEEVDELSRVLGVDVETFDERLSTVEARRAMGVAGRSSRRQRRQRDAVDSVAAAVILQAWADSRRRD